MTITPLQRIASSNKNVFVADSVGEAVVLLITGTPPNAVNIGNVNGIWPQFESFNNDNNVWFQQVTGPMFVWAKQGDKSGKGYSFAAASVPLPIVEGTDELSYLIFLLYFVISLAICALR